MIRKSSNTAARAVRATLLGASMLAGMSGAAFAQSAAAPAAAGEDNTVGEIVVTGYRGSLLNATNAKRAAVNFTESVFAKDLGKFPDINLAEALQRVPGIQINRDNMTGEGTQVRVRGLGASFTKVLLNNNTISPATDGGIDDVSSNREVDLNLFPTELFTKLEVNKSPLASQSEGGLSVVNLRPAHAFDNKGAHLNVAINANMGSNAKKSAPGGSIVASKTWDKIGVLAGIAGQRSYFRNTSYWSSGWTNANLACPGCDNSQSNLFTFATAVPANANVGLPTGTPLTIDTLLALNPGLTGNQLTNAYLPRSDRHELLQGWRQRITGVGSIEVRPTDDLRFALDVIANRTKSDWNRYNSNWYVRSSAPGSTGGLVPIGVKVDQNNVVTSGTFANTNFFTTQRRAQEKGTFYLINPSMAWDINNDLKVEAQATLGRSQFNRNMPTLWVSSVNFTGARATYSYNGGDVATVVPSINYADPNSGLWEWGTFSTEIDKRWTATKGAKFDLDYRFLPDHRIKIGAAVDETRRKIQARAQDVSAIVRAAIPQSQVGQYLSVINPDRLPNQGYQQYVIVDDAKFKNAVNWQQLEKNSPAAQFGLNSVSAGDIEENIKAVYAEYNGVYDLMNRDVRVNGGVRYVETDQTVTGPVRVNTSFVNQTRETTYKATLPTLNVSTNLTKDIVLRAGASKTMTRANPQQLLPGTIFSDPSAQSASAGNPELKPYFSKNLDLGAEWYTGGSGYVGVSVFTKNVTGFPTTKTVNATFKDLNVPFSSLTQFQRDSLNSRGGENAPIFLNQPVNTDKVKLKGVEVAWVQPLDFLVEGFGLNTSVTVVSDGETNVPTNVAPRLINVTPYYENDKFSVHVSYVKVAPKLFAGSPQNGFLNAKLYDEGRYQFDMSASYKWTVAGHEATLTFDATNLTNEKIRRSFVDGSAKLPLNVWYPGGTYRLELSTKF